MNYAEILADKLTFEDKINRGESNAGMVESYVGNLETINRSNTGIVSFRWPGVPYPLYFRCGTSDLANFRQIFLSHEYGFRLHELSTLLI